MLSRILPNKNSFYEHCLTYFHTHDFNSYYTVCLQIHVDFEHWQFFEKIGFRAGQFCFYGAGER